MLPPTQIFHPNPIPPHRSIHYFDFRDNNFFTFLYSFTTTVQTSKQYSLVGPTIEVYISGIIMHTIFIVLSPSPKNRLLTTDPRAIAIKLKNTDDEVLSLLIICCNLTK